VYDSKAEFQNAVAGICHVYFWRIIWMQAIPRYFSFKARSVQPLKSNLDLDKNKQSMSNMLEYKNDFTFKKARCVLVCRQTIKNSYQ
jgi:hypothetical protein